MSPCIFCRIASHEASAKIFHEDDSVIAFHDIDPKAPTHLLIIPKKHIGSIDDLTPEDVQLVGNMLLVAKQVARDLNLDKSGYRLVLNTGRDGGQAVFHLHMHLLGGRPMHWPPG
jgi:histidine triad (HIT) family protein